MAATVDRNLDEYASYQVGRYMFLILSPLLMLLGLIFNILSFKLLYPKINSSHTPTSYFYLAVLSVVDTGALFVPGFRGWFKYLIDVDLKYMMNCGWFLFVYFTLADLSVYLIINMTIDRFVAVFFPFSAKLWSTIRRAKIGIVVVTIYLVCINFHLIFSIQTEKVYDHEYTENTTVAIYTGVYKCSVPPQYDYWFNFIWPWVDLSVFSFVPFVILVSLNASILIKSHKQQEAAKALKKNMDREKNQKRTNVILAMICVIFLLTTSPVVILHIIEPYWDLTDPVQDAYHVLATAICEHMMYFNNCFNFWLYFVSWKKFREELRNMFCRGNRVSPSEGDRTFVSTAQSG